MFGSFLPELWLVGTIKVYSGHGSRHCYGIITLTHRDDYGSMLFFMEPGLWKAVGVAALMAGVWIWWHWKSRNKGK